MAALRRLHRPITAKEPVEAQGKEVRRNIVDLRGAGAKEIAPAQRRYGAGDDAMSELSNRLRPLLHDFVHSLQWYRSKGEITPASPSTGKHIAEKWNMSRPELRITDIDVRALVNEARRRGNPIASTSNGYFYAVNKKELEPTIADMIGRESAIRAARQGLEGCYK